ncbi:MAG TPA: thioesterase domain-containing protein [Ktedonobacteraceae bacterium]|jgi:thioesterase domain-containing protein|nr:thioesterase domain-containing protein [Ktedonobacteraceae bacterium]
MQTLLEALQETFYHEIPITRHLGIHAESYEEGQLVLSAPLEPNINHKQTAFAGSLNALVTLAGWGQLWLILKERTLQGKIVIQDSSSNYIRPVDRNLVARCNRPEPEHIDFLQESLRKRGKARIELIAEIYNGEQLAVTFKGRYVISSYA